jgi:hypothetical protein
VREWKAAFFIMRNLVSMSELGILFSFQVWLVNLHDHNYVLAWWPDTKGISSFSEKSESLKLPFSVFFNSSD